MFIVFLERLKMKKSLIAVVLIIIGLSGCCRNDIPRRMQWGGAPTTVLTPPATVNSRNFGVSVPSSQNGVALYVYFTGSAGVGDPLQTVQIAGSEHDRTYSSKPNAGNITLAPLQYGSITQLHSDQHDWNINVTANTTDGIHPYTARSATQAIGSAGTAYGFNVITFDDGNGHQAVVVVVDIGS